MSDAGFENFVKQAQNVEVKNTPLATGTDEVARAYDVDETLGCIHLLSEE